jgi:hypothetical protein
MDIITGGAVAVLWFVVFVYLITRPEHQYDCRDGGATVILSMPIALVAALITACPLMIVQHFLALSHGQFVFLTVCLAVVLYRHKMWVRTQVKKIFEAIA